MVSQEPDRIVPTARASGLWKKYGFATPDELVPETLAMALGVMVIEGRLDSADARLIRKGNRGLIRLRQDILEAGRKRFAIAHELGHWMLHGKISQILSCTSEDMVAKYKASAPEVEANYFAAELLMPQAIFRARVGDENPTADLIRELSTFFLTSFTATAVRFVEVSDEPCAMVVTERGQVRWWRASDQLKGRFWLSSRANVSPNTVAGSYFAGEPLPKGPEVVEAEAWIGEQAHKVADSFYESAFSLDRYNQVISLLWPA